MCNIILKIFKNKKFNCKKGGEIYESLKFGEE